MTNELTKSRYSLHITTKDSHVTPELLRTKYPSSETETDSFSML